MQQQIQEHSRPKGSGYSYAGSFDRAKRINWTVDGLLAGNGFSPDRRWLPDALSAVQFLSGYSEELLRQVTQIEMGSYSHLFGYVEEFIAPLMAKRSSDHAIDNIDGFNALSNFVTEEIKHMELFREVRKKADETLDLELELLDDNAGVAKSVLSNCDAAVLLLTACIEWLTQHHYIEAFEAQGDTLDPLTLQIFKSHWLEESQHAQIDHLETLREFSALSEEAKDVAAVELAGLVLAVDGLLEAQTGMDVRNLERLRGQALAADERSEITEAILKAKRYTFIGSGVTHPKFQDLFGTVFTQDQQSIVVSRIAHLL